MLCLPLHSHQKVKNEPPGSSPTPRALGLPRSPSLTQLREPEKLILILCGVVHVQLRHLQTVHRGFA